MRLKRGVKLSGLSTQALLAAIVVDSVYAEHEKDLVITSLNDSQHGRGSLHFKGLAFDGRTNFFDSATARTVADQCKKRLGTEFDVVLEDDHLHVEWDPKTR